MKAMRTSVLLAAVLGSMTLVFAADAAQEGVKTPSVEGTWLGTLKVSAIELRIVFNFSAKPDGSFSGTLDSPDQGTAGIPMSRVASKRSGSRRKSAASGAASRGR